MQPRARREYGDCALSHGHQKQCCHAELPGYSGKRETAWFSGMRERSNPYYSKSSQQEKSSRLFRTPVRNNREFLTKIGGLCSYWTIKLRRLYMESEKEKSSRLFRTPVRNNREFLTKIGG